MRLLYASVCAGTILILSSLFFGCSPVIVLEAQSLPATVHGLWTPSVVDATHDAPTQYAIALDGGPKVPAPLADCSGQTCSAPILVPSFSTHTACFFAENAVVSTDQTTLQDSTPPICVSFKLNQSPNAVSGATVGK